jgi:FkbM family methyltransferase
VSSAAASDAHAGVADRVQRRNDRDDRNLAVVMAWVLQLNSNCVDVGALGGTVLQRMVALAPAGRHIAFEPLPLYHARLVQRFPGVDVRRVALSDREGEAGFVHVKDFPGYSGLLEREHPRSEVEEISVRMQTLDHVLPQGYAPDLIKLDVEGAEVRVLRGALQTLRRHRPFVWFEHGGRCAALHGTTSGQLYDLLVEDVGMRIFDADGIGPYSREQFLGPRPWRTPIWNFAAF